EVDPTIAAPRLATPRTRVPAGSVALAGDLTAVYPRATPGGWRLLGRTDVELFDLDRDPPALLTAGTRVRFREVDRLPGDAGGDAAAAGGDRERAGDDALPVDSDGRLAEGDRAGGVEVL
ncbi:allophanate hydrolase, partial [Actinotalea fermentans ATCC 43279 = JCM 9966 = DSM 3133]